MPAELKSTSQGATMVLTLCNPANRNAMGPEIYAAGVEALSVAESNAEVRSVIITGEGNTFCAGGDLRRLQANRALAADVQLQSIDSLHSWIEAIRTFPKPVIAAVEGAAAGAGFSLALACDFIVAADDAVFAMGYVNVALSPDGGASWSLPRAVPCQLASELLMCGARIGSSRLHAMGLVNRIAGSGRSLAEALQLADKLNAMASNALASIKELVNDAPSATLHEQLAREREHFARNLVHANAGAGIAAFLEKKAARDA